MFGYVGIKRKLPGVNTQQRHIHTQGTILVRTVIATGSERAGIASLMGKHGLNHEPGVTLSHRPVSVYVFLSFALQPVAGSPLLSFSSVWAL